MAKSFYLLDREKEREYKAFEKWWDDRVEKFKEDITSYCHGISGVLVNEDLAEDIISSDQFPKFFPVYDTSYCRRIGYLGNSRIYCWDDERFWAYGYYNQDFSSFYHDRNEREINILEKILNENPERIIIDEDNYRVSLNDFKLMCKTGDYKNPSDKI